MARKLHIEESDREDFLTLFQKAFDSLCGKRLQKGENSIKFDDVLNSTKSTVLSFSRTAWIKMTALVMNMSGEVGWHGTVSRTENGFIVNDIFVFPQEVTGATVTPDQAMYNEWIDRLPDDVFNALRFHGHSHVNMGVTPSSVDTNFRKAILDNMQVDTGDGNWFYIFLIINKNLAIEAEIYDMDNNVVYSRNDLLIDIELEDGDTLQQFISESEKMVKRPACKATQYQSPSYPGYQGSKLKKSGTYTDIKTKQIAENSKKSYPKSAVDDVMTEEEIRKLNYYYGYYDLD